MKKYLITLLLWGLAHVQVWAAPISAGQWYDRTHAGHGLDVNRAGDTLFGTFYTYAADNRAEWLWLQVPNSDSPSGELTRFRKNGTAFPSAEVAGQFSLRSVSACSDGVARPGAAELLEFRVNLPQGTLNWCLEPLLPSAPVALSALDGHWFAPDLDAGWGLVSHFFPGAGGTQSFHTFYFYDSSGAPRWAVANATGSNFAQDLDFYTLRTSCFGCATNQLSAAPIGQAKVRLASTQNNSEATNQLQINLRFDENASFTRNGRLLLLSAPRPVSLVKPTAQGLVQGAVNGNVESYLAIPYVAPPLAELRMRAPQPAPTRNAVFQARTLGPGCLQPSGQALFAAVPAQQSEDCLQLNVYAPVGASKKPVMLWIHGGGLTIGSAVEQISGRLVYDGAAFARKDVVFVSTNYRLGAFGYLAARPMQGEASDQPAAGNYGLLDQIAALKWVRANIAQFGGDPEQITIFGESAGAVSVCALMAAPAARGLFVRAISQSGGCLRAPQTLEAALTQGDRVIANAGCGNLSNASDTRSCLRNLSAANFLTASRAVVNLSGTQSGESYGLTVDGFALTEAPGSAISSGRAMQIPYLLGVNDDESTSTNPASALPATAAGYEANVRAQFGLIGDLVLARYPLSNYSTPQKALQDIYDDVRFVCATRRAAFDHAQRGNAVFHYVLSETLPDAQLAPLESYHGIDIIFLFERSNALLPELNLRAKMQNAWINFARTGNPDPDSGTGAAPSLGYRWSRYDTNGFSAELSSSANAGISNYRKDYCDFWARYVAL
jgi:para-nitrobenzyl esterase